MPNKYYPFILLAIIFTAIYLMYGEAFSPRQVDISKYRELCLKYQSAPKDTYPMAEIQMLINEVHYLLPNEIDELKEENERELKACALKLAERINKGSL